MDVETPIEPAYYFECSFGRTRLSYFMPVEHLQELAAAEKISANVLEDFPDGVDLDCTEPDFANFESAYGFRPKSKATFLREAFLAMYSATHDWENFHGTGFVRASDLESKAEAVKARLEAEDIAPEEVVEIPTVLESFPQRRKWTRQQMQKQSKVTELMIEMEVEEADKSKSIKQQAFAQVPMRKGKKPEEVFESLHRNRNIKNRDR